MPDRPTYRLTLNRLLKEAQEQHHAAETRLGFKHDWEDWYAAYISARVYGLSVKAANAAADEQLRANHGLGPA